MTGVELAKRLRRDALTENLPLLMLTARNEESDILKSFESGIDDYMSKPFSPKELVARIRRCCVVQAHQKTICWKRPAFAST